MKRTLEKLVTILVPIAAHACSLSIVDHFGQPGITSDPMFPNTASLMFVAATSIIVANWLEKNSVHLLGTNATKACFITTLGIVSNVASCELSLRLLWIPVQYFLGYLRDEKILAVIVRTLSCYLQAFERTRKLLSSWMQASKEEPVYKFTRNLIAALYLVSVLSKFNYLPRLRTLRRDKRPVCVVGDENTHLK
ncbi:uncharacterized protein LOC131686131 [Topomyia yanbarensis]|uniref:uncharacterized protein LOC131686131 n=1 Tax=Topomyia yanbarensis TaxID=2498891 RepID=UPI00273CBE6A|nr:uncharacterized protein LOC131686131 [Topomyia yanbarensis]